MSTVHVYSEGWQPLTEFYDSGSDRTIRYNERKVIRCHECRDWRWAKWLKVQAYYDGWRIQCADGCYGENRNHRISSPAAIDPIQATESDAARNNENETEKEG